MRHPEIINPYRLDIDRSKDMAFVDDLGIETFLAPVPFHSTDSRALAMETLVDLGSNMDTVEYRQEVFNDLISDTSLRTNVQKYVMGLSEIQDKVNGYKGGSSPARKPTLIKGFTKVAILSFNIADASIKGSRTSALERPKVSKIALIPAGFPS